MEEYWQFAISPDCNSCDLDNNNENNAYRVFNDDASFERTAYYMTGTVLCDFHLALPIYNQLVIGNVLKNVAIEYGQTVVF